MYFFFGFCFLFFASVQEKWDKNKRNKGRILRVLYLQRCVGEKNKKEGRKVGRKES